MRRVLEPANPESRSSKRQCQGVVVFDRETRNVATSCAQQDAASAGLRYVSDAQSGIRRRRSGTGFSYLRPDSCRLSDPAVVQRLRSLAIPPAWQDVWIWPPKPSFSARRYDGHKVGTQNKDDPADVAKTGFDAMIRRERVVSGWQNKILVAAAHVMPAETLARQHTKMAALGTTDK